MDLPLAGLASPGPTAACPPHFKRTTTDELWILALRVAVPSQYGADRRGTSQADPTLVMEGPARLRGSATLAAAARKRLS